MIKLAHSFVQTHFDISEMVINKREPCATFITVMFVFNQIFYSVFLKGTDETLMFFPSKSMILPSSHNIHC
jgi:hypothetical protein